MHFHSFYRVYNLFDVLSDIGGLKESVVIIGMLIAELFTEKLFVSKMISRIYQVESTPADFNGPPSSSEQ